MHAALKHAKTAQKKNRLFYGEYYTEHYLKPETDEKGNTIFRIIPAKRSVELQILFKYCSRVHSDINTTLQIYTHATDVMASRSVDIFEKAVNA